MKLYKFIYYRLYCLWLLKKDEKDKAHINAAISISFLIGINVLTIPILFIPLFWKYPNLSVPPTFKWLVFSLVFGLELVNTIILLSKHRYLKIIHYFTNEDEQKRKKGIVIAIVYVIITICFPILYGFVIINAHVP